MQNPTHTQHCVLQQSGFIAATCGAILFCISFIGCGGNSNNDDKSATDRATSNADKRAVNAKEATKPIVVCTTPILAQIVRELAAEHVYTYSLTQPIPTGNQGELIQTSTNTSINLRALRSPDIELIKSATLLLDHQNNDADNSKSKFSSIALRKNARYLSTIPVDDSSSLATPALNNWIVASGYRHLVIETYSALASELDIATAMRPNRVAMLVKLDELNTWIEQRKETISARSHPTLITNSQSLAALAESLDIQVTLAELDTSAPPTVIDQQILAKVISTSKPTALWFDVAGNAIWTEMIHATAVDAKCNVVGQLLLDNFTDESGPCPNYISLTKHNINSLVAAMQKSQ